MNIIEKLLRATHRLSRNELYQMKETSACGWILIAIY